ncbi:cytochrome P450 9e2 [Spodoptera frugiperda]|uniref:unspecific monooxygenase n=1 Tax=Spodoptera frugiperda TaxID=7108 RepID=A0A9R0EH33_SPOFR|nr:cytochrome P450 9e2 [Spodoptera frugiperda]
MILELLIFVITVLVAYYFYSSWKINNYFKQRDVKYIPGVPFFGNIFYSTFLIRHFVDDLQSVYDAFPDEKYVGFLENLAPVMLIKDPELIKSITIKDFDHFTDHKEFFTTDSDPLFAGSLLMMKGDKWRQMRTTLSPAFTGSKMKMMLPLIVDSADNIVEYLNDHQTEDVDVDDLMRRYTSDVIATAAFGLKVNSLKDRDNEFYRVGSSLFEFTLTQRLLMFSTLLPSLSKKLGTRLFPETTYNFFRTIVSSTLEYRKREKVERPDMIQLLMETPIEWTPDELTGQVFIFFAAGFETSASGLTMAIHELALHPDIQERLYQESSKFKNDKELTFDKLSQLKYLECVINETLRIWSPAIFMDRTCVKAYELPPPREGGKPCIVKPGEVVYNMVNCLHMDPKYFPEPKVFNPDRFSDENKHNIQPCTFAPFGGGPRICIGVRFAMMEIKVLLHHIILNFKIVKTKKTADPIKLKPHVFNIRTMTGTWVRFEKRQ